MALPKVMRLLRQNSCVYFLAFKLRSRMFSDFLCPQLVFATQPKSVGAETSFAEDLRDRDRMNQELEHIAQTLHQRLEERYSGRTLTLKVKFSNYQQITRSRTLMTSIRELATIMAIATELFSGIDLEERHVRLLGLSLSNLDDKKDARLVQLPLFEIDLHPVGCET
jgi:nucleotidyltransferase/DNA polymerase involved in DNA repair